MAFFVTGPKLTKTNNSHYLFCSWIWDLTGLSLGVLAQNNLTCSCNQGVTWCEFILKVSLLTGLMVEPWRVQDLKGGIAGATRETHFFLCVFPTWPFHMAALGSWISYMMTEGSWSECPKRVSRERVSQQNLPGLRRYTVNFAAYIHWETQGLLMFVLGSGDP